MTTTRVASVNAYVILTDPQADALLRGVLRNGTPDLAGIQEWDGPRPDLTAIRRRDVDRLLRAATDDRYRFARPRGGGGPQVWNRDRYHLLFLDAEQLVGPEFVGHLPGRKSRLPASTASVGIYADRLDGGETVLINVHLTAEVQRGSGYRRDLAHRLRVRRHKRERRAIRRLARIHLRAGRRVFVVGDFNFDGLRLWPLVACWDGHPRKERAGTLGHRTVDYVFAETRADRVQVLTTRSDHDAVVAVYKEKP